MKEHALLQVSFVFAHLCVSDEREVVAQCSDLKKYKNKGQTKSSDSWKGFQSRLEMSMNDFKSHYPKIKKKWNSSELP